MDSSKLKIETPIEVNGYILLAEIGRGSTGCVRVARKSETNIDYCVKIVPKILLITEEDKTFFTREYETLRVIDHPNISRFIELTEDENNFYLFMEYCLGIPLQRILSLDGPLPERRIQIIFKQLMQALEYLHSKNIAHRDIKPDNIIINNSDQLKLVDFGLCTNHSDVLRQTFCGSPAFAAPECICRKPYEATASDIWSAGVLLYAMAVGQLPWKINNINLMVRQIVEGKYCFPNTVNQQMQSFIKSLMTNDPQHRPTASQALASSYLRFPTIMVRPRAKFANRKIVSQSFDNSPLHKIKSNPSFTPIRRPMTGKSVPIHSQSSHRKPINHLNNKSFDITPPNTPSSSKRGSFHRNKLYQSVSIDKFELDETPHSPRMINSRDQSTQP